MTTRLCLFLAVLMWLVTGCGGASLGQGGGSRGYSAAKSSPTSAPAFERSLPTGGAASTTASPQSPSADFGGGTGRFVDTTPAPEVRDRPGLGTEWGETRESRVHDVTFVRGDERPFAIAAMHYNDAQGVQALAAFHDGSGARFREVPAGGGAITISIRDGNGEALPALRTSDRIYVVGQEGQRYSIVLTNHTNHRFESVATVDGLDVISGQPGTLASRGYVLMPFATLEIDGFRQSHEAVAAFRFARVADSYAAQTSGDRNVGVIGVAFFSERGDAFDPWSDGELERRDTASPFPGQDPRFARPPR